MFVNIVRADSYRFVRSRFARIAAACFVLLLALFALMMHGGSTFAFGGVIGHKDGVALIDGFYGFGFTDPADHPQLCQGFGVCDRDVSQRLVIHDHVGRKAAGACNIQTPLTQLLKHLDDFR